MKILCLNTAFSKAQIALEVDGEAFYKELDANAKSSESVMPAIDELLTKNNVDINDIDVIGVVVGTGSFTGVRIGTALAKGFAVCNKNLKICPVNSLDLMAFEWLQNNISSKEFCSVQNALSGRFFVGYFDKFGNSIKENELVNELPNTQKIGLLCEDLSEVDFYVDLTPNNLLKYVKKLIEYKKFVSAEELAPIYLRLSQAEENLLKEQNAKY